MTILRLIAALLALIFSHCLVHAQESRPLKILTFNAGGVPFVSPLSNRKKRFEDIARRLNKSDYDLVFLQEVWMKRDLKIFTEQSGYPYAAHVNSSMLFGNGLVVLSRFPVLETRVYTFTAAEPFHDFLDGDFWAAKGVLAARLDVGGRALDVYNTHLVANTSGREHIALRHTQLYDLAGAVADFSKGRPFVLAGDFNFPPVYDGHKILTRLLGAWDVCDGNGPGACSGTDVDGRLDYIFLSRHFAEEAILAQDTDFRWERSYPHFKYSDHQGFTATLNPSAINFGALPAAVDTDRRWAVAQVRNSILVHIRDIARRYHERLWIPLYNFGYAIFMSARVVNFINLEREMSMVLQKKDLVYVPAYRMKGMRSRVLWR